MKTANSFKLRLSVVATLMAMSASFAHAAPSANASQKAQDAYASHAAGRLLVIPKAGLPDAEFDKILRAQGGRKSKLGQSNLHVVSLDTKGNETAILAKLAQNPHIKSVELDRLVPASFIPSDPYYGSAYHLPLIGAPAAWDTTQGTGITIAILDSGVDGNHPDLAGAMVPGYNFYNGNTDTSDSNGHGTAVAGVAAAINNAVGVSSIAGQAKIMPMRIADANAYAYYSTIAQGITWAADRGARIANASYGGVAGSSTIINAANYLKGKGGLLFVSAGNNGRDEGILPTDSMVVVSATNQWDSRTSWSSYGSFVTLAAPGEYIWTTTRGGGYGQWNGTSFSSPLSAGVGALMMAANPSLTPNQVQSMLYSTARDIGAGGRDIYYGHGRVDAAAAVAAAVAARPVPDTELPTVAITNPAAGSTVAGLVTVDVNANDNVGVASVQLQVNGTTIATDTTKPFSFSWDSKGAANGMANLVAVAADAAGNAATSTAVAVNVANVTAPVVVDTAAPTVAIINPTAGAVSGTVNIVVNAEDNSGAAGITTVLYIDGGKVSSGTGSTLSYNWNTRKVKAGSHTIQAVSTDKAGNKSSASVTVTR